MDSSTFCRKSESSLGELHLLGHAVSASCYKGLGAPGLGFQGKTAAARDWGRSSAISKRLPSGTVLSTEPGDPIYTHLFQMDARANRWEVVAGPVIMVVDTLPSELPREASNSFGDMLVSFVPRIAAADFGAYLMSLTCRTRSCYAGHCASGRIHPDYYTCPNLFRGCNGKRYLFSALA